MAFFKLAVLSITVLIGLLHGPVLVSCQFPQPPRLGTPTFIPQGGRLNILPVPVPRPVPVQGRRFDERRTVLLLEDDGLQDGGFDGGFGGGFGMILPLLFLSFLLMGLGITTTTAGTTTVTTATTSTAAATTTSTAAAATTAATTTVSTTPVTTNSR